MCLAEIGAVGMQFLYVIIASVLSAAAGGFVGGMTVAYWFGSWRATVDANLKDQRADIAKMENRLSKGDDWLANIPALKAEMTALASELRLLRETLSEVVPRRECEARHGRLGAER